MPLMSAPGRVEASLMQGGKAMANTARIEGGGRWWVAPAGAVAALVAIGAPILAIDAADGRDDMVLTRNEVLHEALGGRTWLGALNNVGRGARTDVVVRIRFHDRHGRPVGSPVSARATRLEPGDGLHLQARIPAEATGLQIWSLQWTTGGRTVRFGPYEPWAFGRIGD